MCFTLSNSLNLFLSYASAASAVESAAYLNSSNQNSEKLLFCFCLPHKPLFFTSVLHPFLWWKSTLCLQGFNFCPRSQDSGLTKPYWQLGKLRLAAWPFSLELDECQHTVQALLLANIFSTGDLKNCSQLRSCFFWFHLHKQPSY